MKRDLDRLMEERGLDVAIVSGPVYGNPTLAYMVNSADISNGTVIKKRGEEPILVHSPIEKDGAAESGLKLISMLKYDPMAIFQKHQDPMDGQIELYRRIFEDLGVRGEVGFYGIMDRGAAYLMLQKLDAEFDDVTVRGEFQKGLFNVARATKDAAEVKLIKEAGRLTCEVIAETMEFVRSHSVKDETLVTDDGSPLTIGRVKQHIYRLLSERRLEDPEGVIFSIGRDAGVGHSSGKPEDPLRLGQSIVYDLYPRLAGGYFFDCTRTFCLGYAPPEVEKAYQDAKECFETVAAAVEVGLEAKRLQQITCEFFAERGYPTIDKDSQIEEGYTHTVGHGVGLAVHEEPSLGDFPSNDRVLQPGHVFALEPGLYYPERGFGVRVEDVIWIDDKGQVHNLTDLPKQLVIEM